MQDAEGVDCRRHTVKAYPEWMPTLMRGPGAGGGVKASPC